MRNARLLAAPSRYLAAGSTAGSCLLESADGRHTVPEDAPAQTKVRRDEIGVLMTAQIPGATKAMIDDLRPVLDAAWHAKGFVISTNGPVPGGSRVVDVWESQADLEAWFEASVKPAFSDGGPMPVGDQIGEACPVSSRALRAACPTSYVGNL